MNKWSKIWPKKTGYYWFYGDPFGKTFSTKSDFHLVQVKAIANNNVICITNGHFLYPSEASDGYWISAQLPELPVEKE